MSKKIVLLSAVLAIVGAGIMLFAHRNAEAKVCFVTDGDCGGEIGSSTPNMEACNNLGFVCDSGNTCQDTRDSAHGASWITSTYGITDPHTDDELWRKIQCPLNHSYFMDCPKSFKTACPTPIYEVSQESCAGLRGCRCPSNYKFTESYMGNYFNESIDEHAKNCYAEGLSCQRFDKQGNPAEIVWNSCVCRHPYVYTEEICQTQYNNSQVPDINDYCMSSTDHETRYYPGCECNRDFYVYAENDPACPEGVDTSLRCQDSSMRYFYHSCRDCSCYPVADEPTLAKLKAAGVAWSYPSLQPVGGDPIPDTVKGDVGCTSGECRQALGDMGLLSPCGSGNSAGCAAYQDDLNASASSLWMDDGSLVPTPSDPGKIVSSGTTSSNTTSKTIPGDKTTGSITKTASALKTEPKGVGDPVASDPGDMPNSTQMYAPWHWDNEVKVDGTAYSYVTCPYNPNRYRILYCYEPGMRPSTSCDQKPDSTIQDPKYYKAGEACVPMSCGEALDTFLKTTAGQKYAKFVQGGKLVGTGDQQERHYLVDGNGNAVVEKYVNTKTGGIILQTHNPAVSKKTYTVSFMTGDNVDVPYYYAESRDIDGAISPEEYSRRTAIVWGNVTVNSNQPSVHTYLQTKAWCQIRGCHDADGNFWRVLREDATVMDHGNSPKYWVAYKNKCTLTPTQHYWVFGENVDLGNYAEANWSATGTPGISPLSSTDFTDEDDDACGAYNQEHNRCIDCKRSMGPVAYNYNAGNCEVNNWSEDKPMTLQQGVIGEHCIFSEPVPVFSYGGLNGAPADRYISIKHLVMELEKSATTEVYAGILKKACSVQIQNKPKITFKAGGAFPVDDAFVKKNEQQYNYYHATVPDMEFAGVDVQFNEAVQITRNITFKDSTVTTQKGIVNKGTVSVLADLENNLVLEGVTTLGQEGNLIIKQGLTNSGTINLANSDVELCGTFTNTASGTVNLVSTRTPTNLFEKGASCTATLINESEFMSKKYRYVLNNFRTDVDATADSCKQVAFSGVNSIDGDMNISNTLTLRGLSLFDDMRIEAKNVVVGKQIPNVAVSFLTTPSNATAVQLTNGTELRVSETFEIFSPSEIGRASGTNSIYLNNGTTKYQRLLASIRTRMVGEKRSSICQYSKKNWLGQMIDYQEEISQGGCYEKSANCPKIARYNAGSSLGNLDIADGGYIQRPSTMGNCSIVSDANLCSQGEWTVGCSVAVDTLGTSGVCLYNSAGIDTNNPAVFDNYGTMPTANHTTCTYGGNNGYYISNICTRQTIKGCVISYKYVGQWYYRNSAEYEPGQTVLVATFGTCPTMLKYNRSGLSGLNNINPSSTY